MPKRKTLSYFSVNNTELFDVTLNKQHFELQKWFPFYKRKKPDAPSTSAFFTQNTDCFFLRKSIANKTVYNWRNLYKRARWPFLLGMGLHFKRRCPAGIIYYVRCNENNTSAKVQKYFNRSAEY